MSRRLPSGEATVYGPATQPLLSNLSQAALIVGSRCSGVRSSTRSSLSSARDSLNARRAGMLASTYLRSRSMITIGTRL